MQVWPQAQGRQLLWWMTEGGQLSIQSSEAGSRASPGMALDQTAEDSSRMSRATKPPQREP